MTTAEVVEMFDAALMDSAISTDGKTGGDISAAVVPNIGGGPGCTVHISVAEIKAASIGDSVDSLCLNLEEFITQLRKRVL